MSEDAADRLVARAIESVLEQVPGAVDTSQPEGGVAKLQPWAETAAPVGRNKRPLEELLTELEARVSLSPEARADIPATRHPALAFFDRFGRGGRPDVDGGGEPAEGGSRRRRRRRGGGGGETAHHTEAGTPSQATAPGDRPRSGRRRSRRGRGGPANGGGVRPGAAAQGGGPSAPGQDAPGRAQGPGPPSASRGGRRRRGRRGRGRGGDRPAAG